MVDIGQNSLNGRERDCLFRSNGDGSFTDTAWVNQSDRIEDGRGISILDYDLDGQVDVVVRNYKQPAQLLRNRGGSGHWIELKLIGTQSNRDAVGAKVAIGAGERHQSREVHAGSGYLSGSSLVQHFGLGEAARVDSVDVRWPSGRHSQLADLASNRQYVLREGDPEAHAVETWKVSE